MKNSMFCDLKYGIQGSVILSNNGNYINNNIDRLDNEQYNELKKLITEFIINIDRMYYVEEIRVWKFHEAPSEYQISVGGDEDNVAIMSKQKYKQEGIPDIFKTKQFGNILHVVEINEYEVAFIGTHSYEY